MLNDKGKGTVDEDGFPVGSKVPGRLRQSVREGRVTVDEARRRLRRNAARRAKDDVMRSLGLVRVRGALGGTYWE